MKRRLDSIDVCIPEKVWDMFPDKKESLENIKKLEQKLEDIQTSMRAKYTRVVTPQITKKILRIFMHHQFIPSTTEEKAHFLVSVEGTILCPTLMNYVHFGNFFDRMIFQIEKKATIDKVLEWSAATHPEGVKSDCFRFKIYGDKPQLLKAYFYRSNDPRPRYEISEKLRAIFPQMPIEVPEEDVFIAMWAYLQSNDLFVISRDKKLIRCDDNMKLLVGTQADTCPITVLPAKITENLTISNTLYPIQMDYPLLTASTKLDTMFASFGPSQFARLGGRAVDIEVDVQDYTSHEAVRGLTQMASNIVQTDAEIAKLEPWLRYQANSINRLATQMFASTDKNNNNNLADALGLNLPFVNPALSVASESQFSEPSSQTDPPPALSQLPIHELIAWVSDSARLLEHRKVMPKKNANVSSTLSADENIFFSRLQAQPVVTTVQEQLTHSLALGPDSMSAIHNLRGFIDVGADPELLRGEVKRRLEVIAAASRQNDVEMEVSHTTNNDNQKRETEQESVENESFMYPLATTDSHEDETDMS